jgi:hypothetical protein
MGYVIIKPPVMIITINSCTSTYLWKLELEIKKQKHKNLLYAINANANIVSIL